MAVNVLVVFYSRYGETEKRATAAGVGAIQARANIRLRRLHDLADPASMASDAAWQSARERFARDYIAPREVDAQWADVILVASPSAANPEMTAYLAELAASHGKAVVHIMDAASAVADGTRAAEQAGERKTN
jgi:hypothetical protein